MVEIIVSIVTGVLTLVGTCVTAWATTRKTGADMAAKVDKLVEHDHDQYLSILRLTVVSPDMPISERLIAGKKYIDAGGNGDVKHYYQTMLEEHTK